MSHTSWGSPLEELKRQFGPKSVRNAPFILVRCGNKRDKGGWTLHRNCPSTASSFYFPWLHLHVVSDGVGQNDDAALSRSQVVIPDRLQSAVHSGTTAATCTRTRARISVEATRLST